MDYVKQMELSQLKSPIYMNLISSWSIDGSIVSVILSGYSRMSVDLIAYAKRIRLP